MKKKALLLMMSLVLMFVLAACGSTSNSNNNVNSGASTESAAPAEGSANAAAETEGNASTAAGTTEATAPAEVTIKHQLGEATLKTNPEKVVVFDFGTLDTLNKLGVNVTALPKDSLPSYLKETYTTDAYENAGTLFEPDFEKLASLKPDVIFISGRASEAYEELSKIAPTIYTGVDTAKYMESFKQNLSVIGQIFNKTAEVEAELAALEASIQSVNAAATASGKKGLIVLTTGGKMSAFGKGSRFGFIHDVLGVPASDESIEVGTHGMSVTSEFIAEKNPDYLFVVDRDAVVEKEGAKAGKDVIENALVKNTNAFKNGKIAYLDPNYWYLSGGGLESTAQMIQAVEAVVK
ncbi:siderophore ABC transporter substrate-binding protein [Paenibacillus methanolicus]|uniref:Iron complex transport system substrate-binding protein n=1 Tax=Paenibacillus methanolicus TaxID=582686 RepID=A0A5S5BV15_9BACL|nr:siderophore ABC transporter substrate-binding protein [Paenibacillus methanolicus]TYP70804.1 iron complex transport system substrate-binding protein [Paenibacillus methanolicus]